MAKKEFPKINNKEEFSEAPPARGGKIAGGIFGVLKFILGICLLPLVYSASISFLNEFQALERAVQNSFWAGVIALLIVYLFIWEPAAIYLKGQRLLEIVFAFFKPMVRFAPYLVPIYTLLLFFIYALLSAMQKSERLLGYFIFLFGFSFALHLVFGAKSLRSRKGDFLKGNYIFGFSFVYVFSVFILALLLNLIFANFSVVDFSNDAFRTCGDIFHFIFRQLFL